MRKLTFAAVMILLVIASCTKKSAPTAKEPAINGAPIFANNCARCHGATGREGQAPNLAQAGRIKEDVIETVTFGAGHMPPFKQKLSAKEIDAVATFVVHLSK